MITSRTWSGRRATWWSSQKGVVKLPCLPIQRAPFSYSPRWDRVLSRYRQGRLTSPSWTFAGLPCTRRQAGRTENGYSGRWASDLIQIVGMGYGNPASVIVSWFAR